MQSHSSRTSVDGDWIPIGDVDVDSAAILICEPSTASTYSKDWENQGYEMVDDVTVVHDRLAKALVVGTPGDGRYRILGRYKDNIDGHKTLTGILIDFEIGDS